MRSTTAGCWVLALTALLLAGWQDADPSAANQLVQDKAALSILQDLVGGWRGVGQPKRGSSKDAWTEQADWAWQFADSRATLVFETPQGRFFSAGRLMPAEEPGRFELLATLPDGQTQERYTGELTSEGRLVLQAVDSLDGRPAQISIRTVAGGDRLLVLLEKRQGEDRFARLAEVGYTRKGSGFGKGGGGPECVVTGGYGTMTVEHEGQSYYVCCTGCRDLFEMDPEGVLADYRDRKAKERSAAE